MASYDDSEHRRDQALAVLAVDDDRGDASLLSRHLGHLHRYTIDFHHATKFADAQKALKSRDFDVIILDFQLGAETGHDVLRALRAAGDIRPIIMLTGCGDESLAAALMRDGADDYLVKDQIEPKALLRAIENAKSQYARRQLEVGNRQLLEDLQVAKSMLEVKNRRLAELYDTAHEFVDHVSHEFRTPLTVIREFASIMHDGLTGEMTDEQCSYLDIIIHRVDDLSILVDDMLDISKVESGVLGMNRNDVRAEDIVERIRPVLERRAAMASASFSIEIAQELPPIYCDPEKISRVILNLVINALKFCGENGKVALRVEACTDERALKFSVVDNGPGIAPETLKSLFQRFRQVCGQARSGLKGFGLGLSIAKELVKLNFGDITVESEVGVGSVFSFTVPYAERRALLERYLSRVEELRSNGTHVCLIRVSFQGSESSSQFDELAHVLRQVIRRSDLLFNDSEQSIRLVAVVNRDSACDFATRIEKAHAEALANRGGKQMEPPKIEVLGNWSIQDESDAFLSAFEETACNVMAPVNG